MKAGSRIAIYGAGGFGKEVKGMAELQGLNIVGFIDDFKKESLHAHTDLFDDVIVAIADPQIRYDIIKNWSLGDRTFEAFVSNDIQLHQTVQIGRGSVICPGVKITVEVSIGEFVIINLNATIGHDVIIGDFCSLMPSVNISGNVKMGQRVFVGSGATIFQGVTIGDDAIIGAGSVVTRNVNAREKVIGIPAKPR